MTTEKPAPRVGDVVIYVSSYGARPVTHNIEKVTSAGWIRVRVGTATTASLFKPNWTGSYKSAGIGTRSSAEVHLYSDEKLAELINRADEAEANRKEKEKAELERRAANDARHAEELAEVKAAMNNSIMSHVRHVEVLPNGARMLWLNMPVQPSKVERKGTVEVVFVKLHVREARYGQEGNEIEANFTYTNSSNSGGSFSSCSGYAGKTEEEALWEVACNVYQSW